MKTMTPETIAELRRLAEAATPGPWSYFGPDQHGCDPCIESADHYVTDLHATDEDAAYIVAANPAVMLALLDAAAELLVCKTVARGHLEHAERRAAERDALAAKVALVRDWLDHRGVDASDRDGAYMDGYRAAQRHAVLDAAELRAALGEEPQP